MDHNFESALSVAERKEFNKLTATDIKRPAGNVFSACSKDDLMSPLTENVFCKKIMNL